jgi:hypothetical protein
MNRFTITDVQVLGQVYNDNIPNDTGLTDKDIKEFGSALDYEDLMKRVIAEKETPEKSLMEFLGAYDSVVYDEKSWNMLHDFLYQTPLNDMPRYLNCSESELWKSRIAQWRLKINK